MYVSLSTAERTAILTYVSGRFCQLRKASWHCRHVTWFLTSCQLQMLKGTASHFGSNTDNINFVILNQYHWITIWEHKFVSKIFSVHARILAEFLQQLLQKPCFVLCVTSNVRANSSNAWEKIMIFVVCYFFQNLLFWKILSGMHTIIVSNSLDPDQVWHSVGPDLGTNCFQKSSVDRH